MASKTVWVVGGIVVVLGVVGYITHKQGPANTTAGGTIVEAKRARADGTNSVNPTPTASTTDQSSDASTGTSGADAAKDAAGAAGTGSNVVTNPKVAGSEHNQAREAADAAKAATSDGSNARKMNIANQGQGVKSNAVSAATSAESHK